MKRLFILLLLTTYSISILAQDTKITTYYLIRHAEKVSKNKTDKDPNLSEKGTKRAFFWSEVFKNIKFDAVYSTKYNRTIQTAKPTATRNQLKIKFYNPSQLYSEKFKIATKGKTVLIVGHSNTTPLFVNAILGKEKYLEIDDFNNSNLYIISLSNSLSTDELIMIPY